MIYQFVASAKEDIDIIGKLRSYFTDLEVELLQHLIKASSAEFFSMAGFFYLIVITFLTKESFVRESQEKHQPWVRQMIPQVILICFVTVIIFLTNPLMQPILGKKAAILMSQPVIEKMLLGVVVLSGIILVYLCYKFKQWGDIWGYFFSS